MTQNTYTELLDRLTRLEAKLDAVIAALSVLAEGHEDIAVTIEAINTRVFDINLDYGDGFGTDN